MRKALIASIVLHAGALAATFIEWPFAPKHLDDLSPPVPVELVTVAELTNIPKQLPKPKIKPEPKKPEQIKHDKTPPPPPPPPPEVTPEPAKPEPKPEPPKPEPPKPEPKPEPAPAETPKPAPKLHPVPPKPEKVEKPKEPDKPAPVKLAKKEPDLKPKPKQKKPHVPPRPESKDDFDPTKIAALLDKSAKQDTPNEQFDVNQIREALKVTPVNTPTTASEQLTMSELDALRARLAQCWNLPAGAQDAQNLIVKVHIWLNPDGSLARNPEVVNHGGGGEAGQYFQIAAESAVRAVYACRDAFSLLPQEKYGTWGDMIINFDPKEMLSG